MNGMREVPIVALVYDFDQTLSPCNMQEYGFIPGIGMSADAFWAECRKNAVEHGMDGVLAYMYTMLKTARGRMRLTAEALRALGRDIEFYPGVEGWFRRINEIGRARGAAVEHYIVSSGLKEIIEGSKIAHEFKEIFATSYMYDEDGEALWPATAVNYTSKTQYLFRINKGIFDITNDRDLNAYTPDHKRYVPFSNMIYIGDGPTDVPCMKLTKSKGGSSIAVYKDEDPRAGDDMILKGRVDFSLPADFTEGSEMETVVLRLIDKIRASHDYAVLHSSQVDRAMKRARN